MCMSHFDTKYQYLKNNAIVDGCSVCSRNLMHMYFIDEYISYLCVFARFYTFYVQFAIMFG